MGKEIHSSDKNLKCLNFEAFLQRHSCIPAGTGLTAPPSSSRRKLSAIPVPTGEDGGVRGLQRAQQRQLRGSTATKPDVPPLTEEPGAVTVLQTPRLSYAQPSNKLNHSHIRCSVEGPLHILLGANNRKKSLARVFDELELCRYSNTATSTPKKSSENAKPALSNILNRYYSFESNF